MRCGVCNKTKTQTKRKVGAWAMDPDAKPGGVRVAGNMVWCCGNGPPKGWKFSKPVWAPAPTNRFHVLGPLPLKPAQWAKICPRPADWRED